MMRLAVILVVGACNGVLGLGTVVPQSDAPGDASRQCPSIGTVPSYGSLVTQFYIYEVPFCASAQFDASGTRMLASCFDAVQCTDTTYEGPSTGPLTAVDPVMRRYGYASFDPDGDHIYAYDLVASHEAILRRDPSGWVEESIAPFTAYLSSVARIGDEARLIASTPGSGGQVFQEWSGTAGSWTPVGASFTAADVGLMSIDYTHVDLGQDGLRVIVSGLALGAKELAMFYLDRASLADPFSMARPMAIPLIDAFITADCTRIYFSGLDRIFYLDRQ